ncbi:hypothetical protein J7E99_20715 [Streptomyces sp. ISL-44]|uniref:hypothetical protein n=1 Tax=Streptomyces sp. ISL-44 TaxID=2819184 RepID=UPI001BEA1817|nr:hypothetical protein [Streptomyces sp. ISL-44]MBT2543064.1 hypothetical protein [Streptomyces sp. ISL-44]
MLPIENGRWLVTLAGTRGGEPTSSEEDFIPFAQNLRHPLISELLTNAEPLGPVHRSHGLGNRRRYFERLRTWPEGFLVLGDAVATYNPGYGHGMSAAALATCELHRDAAQLTAPGGARRLQRAIGRATDAAWTVATSQDILYPQAIGPRPTPLERLAQRYFERMTTAINGRAAAANALYEVFALAAPLTRSITPPALLAALLGPKNAPSPGPPLTAAERTAMRKPPQASKTPQRQP